MQNMLWGEALQLREKGITNLGAELKFKLSELMVLLGTPNISDIFPVLSRLDMQGIERRAKKISLWFENIINSGVEQYRNKVAVVKGEEDVAEKKIEVSRNKDFLQLLLELQENKDSASSIESRTPGMLSNYPQTAVKAQLYICMSDVLTHLMAKNVFQLL